MHLLLQKGRTESGWHVWPKKTKQNKTRLHFHSRLHFKITCVWTHAWPSRIPGNRRQTLFWQLHIIIHKNLVVLWCSIISIKLIDTCMSNLIRKWHFLWERLSSCVSYKGCFFHSWRKLWLELFLRRHLWVRGMWTNYWPLSFNNSPYGDHEKYLLWNYKLTLWHLISHGSNQWVL